MSIRAENLWYSYPTAEVLRGIDLAADAGERVGIIGISGGGKSTLLKLLSGLYAPQTGFVEVHGARTPKAIRAQTAMVMQSAMLFPASIRDNITCGHPMDDSIIQNACDAAQLTAWIQTLPDGIDSFVGERGGKVSGGQAQRIAIARAIAKDALVILLDEATSALDGSTGGAVLSALMRLTQGKTVISVSHKPGDLTNCDSVYQLEAGRLSHA